MAARASGFHVIGRAMHAPTGDMVHMILRFGAPRSYPRASSLALTGNSPYRALRDNVCNSEDDGAQFGGETAG